MNSRLAKLHPYPFARLNLLLADIATVSDEPLISLALGEPKHAASAFLVEAYQDAELIIKGFATYPLTRGLTELKQAIANFINRRFNLSTHPISAATQVLPVNGTREALFALAQAVIDPINPGLTLMPNPFYQIYEGAAILAGSEPKYLPCVWENDFIPNFAEVTVDTWQACQLLYICSPGNPTGTVIAEPELEYLIEMALTYDFVIASDECYSEIYPDELLPPPGLLGACVSAGNDTYRNCLAFNSLSKRSNLPGLRSGYVAGDAALIEKFLLYRTYHGSGMSVHNQILSCAAWADEQHVIANRSLYRDKFTAVLDILEPVWPLKKPPAGFYLWPETPHADTEFTRVLFKEMNIKVLPGSYLSREINGVNPGANRIRIALVASLNECINAAERLKAFMGY